MARMVLGGALTLAITTGALAADMPALPTTDAAYDGQTVELGTNWYLRGDVGFTIPGTEDLLNDADNSSLERALDVGLAFGYDFGQTRFDISADYFRKSDSSVPLNTESCGANTGPGTDATCTLFEDYKKDNFLIMANGFYNFEKYDGWTPFIGAGIGALVSIGDSKKSVNCVPGSSGTCEAPFPAGETSVRTRGDSGQTWRPALALMAGLSYDVDENLSLDATYRLVGVINADEKISGGKTEKVNHYDNQVRLGFRYKVN